MCFSPEVSFIAGTTMTLVGVLTLKKAERKRDIFLASLPLLFASQQFIEGFLWLSLLKGQEQAHFWFTQAFIVYAAVLWPVLVPVSLLAIERKPQRKYGIMLPILIGLGIAGVAMQKMFSQGITSSIVNCCIRYEYAGPQFDYSILFYICATCLPFFFSSHRMIRVVGVAMLASFFAAYSLYEKTYVSVWCFFAAAISGLIYLHFSEVGRRLIKVRK